MPCRVHIRALYESLHAAQAWLGVRAGDTLASLGPLTEPQRAPAGFRRGLRAGSGATRRAACSSACQPALSGDELIVVAGAANEQARGRRGRVRCHAGRPRRSAVWLAPRCPRLPGRATPSSRPWLLFLDARPGSNPSTSSTASSPPGLQAVSLFPRQETVTFPSASWCRSPTAITSPGAAACAPSTDSACSSRGRRTSSPAATPPSANGAARTWRSPRAARARRAAGHPGWPRRRRCAHGGLRRGDRRGVRPRRLPLRSATISFPGPSRSSPPRSPGCRRSSSSSASGGVNGGLLTAGFIAWLADARSVYRFSRSLCGGDQWPAGRLPPAARQLAFVLTALRAALRAPAVRQPAGGALRRAPRHLVGRGKAARLCLTIGG